MPSKLGNRRSAGTIVITLRTSIYATLARAFEAIALISDHIRLEDMHPANVFVESKTLKPICIDCIVKFFRP